MRELGPSSSSVFGPFPSERDHEMFMIERDLLARIVLKQHCAYRRIDIMDRIKTVVKALDQYLRNPDFDIERCEKLRRLINIASERFFQQVSMGLMIPMSTVCLGALGRLSALLDRITNSKGVNDHIPNILGSQYTCHADDDDGIRIDR